MLVDIKRLMQKANRKREICYTSFPHLSPIFLLLKITVGFMEHMYKTHMTHKFNCDFKKWKDKKRTRSENEASYMENRKPRDPNFLIFFILFLVPLKW